MQAIPNKSKENSLHFLGFLLPNPDFSMGYGRKKIKNHTVRSDCMQNVADGFQAPFSSPSGAPQPGRSGQQKMNSIVSVSLQENGAENFR
jgi:hypothetical protein